MLLWWTDCVEAGLPYDWKRLNIESKTEEDIVRALFKSTQETEALHTTPSQGAGASVGMDTAVGMEARLAVGRWDSVRLKDVKELASSVVEYWQIKMVLARLKSGWSGYS